MNDTTRITVKIRKESKYQFLEWTKEFGLSKDRFLANQIKKEIQFLRKLPENSEKGKKIDRALLLAKDSERFSITLPSSIAEEMNEVCEAIGVARDSFIEMYLDFLINGDEKYGSCSSPLKKMATMLGNPRFEYNAKKDTNPYDDLIWTDDSVEEFLSYFDKDKAEKLAGKSI